jgi:hypothetical protein
MFAMLIGVKETACAEGWRTGRAGWAAATRMRAAVRRGGFVSRFKIKQSIPRIRFMGRRSWMRLTFRPLPLKRDAYARAGEKAAGSAGNVYRRIRKK